MILLKDAFYFRIEQFAGEEQVTSHLDVLLGDQWDIRKIDNNTYEGTASDVVGIAKGVSFGSAFKFEYQLLIPYKNKKIKVRFDDWIFKQDDKTAINKATLTKFFFKVGELIVFFVKD